MSMEREQITRHHTPRKWSKAVKKGLARFWRRWAKRDPENAPKRRPTRGWAD